MEGEKIRIRPAQREDVPLLDSWVNDYGTIGNYNNFGFEGHTSLMSGFEKTGLIDDEQAVIIIENKEGEIVGSMGYHKMIVGPKTAHRIFEIGLHIVPEARGKGYGTEAQALMAVYLFNTYPIIRVQATTDIENIAEQKSLEKAGFRREGVLRKAQWRLGDWHDLVVYSKLRGE